MSTYFAVNNFVGFNCMISSPLLNSSCVQNSLTAHQIMGENLVFMRPVEEVGTVVDILQSTSINSFPVVDTNDRDVLVGTISRNELCVLLKQRAFGQPKEDHANGKPSVRLLHNYIEYDGKRYQPLVDWSVLEGSYPRYPVASEVRVSPRYVSTQVGIGRRFCLSHKKFADSLY